MTNLELLTKVSNWQQFKSTIESLNKKEKGDLFELLTKLYLKVKPEFSDMYDEVWLLNEVPKKVLEHLDLPEQDLGIDLILKSGDEYHAVQCKYHSDKSKAVTFKEVSTFISLLESNEKIKRGYICSTADSISKNLSKIPSKPILILADKWQELDEEFFLNAQKQLQGKKLSLNPYQRQHQKKALKEAVNHFVKEKNERGKLIFPCGSGKSLTGFWITQKLKSKSTLIAVPSLSLVKQTLEVYLREIVANKKKVKWLCICSDEGIGRNDDVVFYTENLGVPCITDEDYIESWLKENKNEEKIIFTTYQSGRIIADISKRLDFTFDVGIFDEAHKTVGSDKKLFSHLLFEENISIKKRVFMTATERFYSGKKDDIISMDDTDIYGETFTMMTFKEAIELELLTDYKVVTIDVRKEEIAEFIKENNLVQLNDKWKKETEARSLASMLALRKAMKRFNIKNAVSFHSSIEKAKRNKELQKYITETYNYDPIDTYTVSGKIPTSKRQVIVKEFADSERSLITNARCLTEGVDVPNIDCIVFADPRKSKVDIVQALGRALRKKEGKEWGYVILPVIYDGETNEIDNDSFQEILNVVRGLASNDERIVEYFKDKAEANNSSPKSNELDNQFQLEVFSDYIDEKDLASQLSIKIWDKLSKFQWKSFEDARNYVRSLNLKNLKEWREYASSELKPYDIPYKPERTYKDSGWIGLGDWLGTNTKRTQDREYLPFEDARDYVQNLGLKNQKDWLNAVQSDWFPTNKIPATPHHVYKNQGWKGLGDWLGTKVIAAREMEFMEFNEARAFVRRLNLTNQSEWREYIKSGNKPELIPSSPRTTYKDCGWISLSDWLGVKDKNTSRRLKNFEDCREFAQSLNLSSKNDWFEYIKEKDLPSDVPRNPYQSYKSKGWSGWGDFLGNESMRPQDIDYLSFEVAKATIQQFRLNSIQEWKEFKDSKRMIKGMPRSPEVVYKNKGWNGYIDFLGIKKKSRFLDFEQAKEIVSQFNIRSSSEWKNSFCKSEIKPKNIPASPDSAYKNKGWKGWKDFLGTE